MLRRVSQLAFGLMLFLLLVSHAPDEGGPFAWLPLPLPLPTAVSNFGWQIGVLALLPIVVVAGWWLGMRQQRLQRLRAGESNAKLYGQFLTRYGLGETAVTGPLFAFSVLVVLRLTGATLSVVAMLGLCWLTYLFLVNNPRWHQTRLWLVLALVLLVQGAVGVAQFMLQRQLGLAWLGEPTLDLLVEGTSVAQRAGQHWLRAYGLNSHPNQLGLLLMTLCLLIWPKRPHAVGWQRWLFWLSLTAGAAGLLVCLSRAAWLGLLLGGAITALVGHRGKVTAMRRELVVPTAILAAGLLFFMLSFGDVLTGRLFALDTPLESRSLMERQRDTSLALELIGQRPFLGVGLGQYLPAAAVLQTDAGVVHNVPLLIGAELGLLGLALWLIFWLWPLWRYGRSAAHKSGTAVWMALILFAIIHPEPSLFLPKGAVLWGLAAAQWCVYPRSRS